MVWFRRNQKTPVAVAENHRMPPTAADGNHNGAGENHNGAGGKSPRGTEPAPGRTPADDRFLAIKHEIHQHVIGTMNPAAFGLMDDDELRLEVRQQAEEMCRCLAQWLSRDDRERLVNEVLDETFGLGPLEPLLQDPEISDILINGPKTIYVERRGRLFKSLVAFHNEQHVLQVVQRIVARMGRRVDETSPMVDARLPDGSRLNAIIRPLALDGPLISIRRFGAQPLLIDDLLRNQSLTEEMRRFLAACVTGRISMVISGGTGSGKTTLLNALSCYIPDTERVATIEDAAELQLQQPHVVRMETRPPNIEGEGAVTTRELVRNALRMRPDRILVGECRGDEALDMLQAMNTGHEGSLTTIHANSPRDALSRLEMMVGMAGFELPVWVIRRQVASAVNIVVQVARLIGGVRRIIKISEISGMDGETMSVHDIYEFVQTGVDEHRAAHGHFLATGVRPLCLGKLESSGLALPPELFERRELKP
jgi:pilus assembly protein CpaF